MLHFELRGQGRTTSLPLEQCGLATHVDDVRQLLDAADFARAPAEPVDLVGFSFGGRVALAVAATMPHRVRRVVVTGVPADRGATGRAILKAWAAALRRGDLEGFELADANAVAVGALPPRQGEAEEQRARRLVQLVVWRLHDVDGPGTCVEADEDALVEHVGLRRATSASRPVSKHPVLVRRLGRRGDRASLKKKKGSGANVAVEGDE